LKNYNFVKYDNVTDYYQKREWNHAVLYDKC
jgi:hypothetical protein